MSIFFSPSRKGFFDEAIHGPRKLIVIDGKALDEAVAAAREIDLADDPDLQQAIAAALEPREEEEDDAPGEQRAAAVLQAAVDQRVAEVVLEPPTMEVDNPDTLIPADAVALSHDDYLKLMADLATGKVVDVVDDRPAAVEREVPLDEQLAAIRLRRNNALAKTDWTQQPDALTEAKRKLWAEHRQALRDLPALLDKAVKAGKSVQSVKFPKPPSR